MHRHMHYLSYLLPFSLYIIKFSSEEHFSLPIFYQDPT